MNHKKTFMIWAISMLFVLSLLSCNQDSSDDKSAANTQDAKADTTAEGVKVSAEKENGKKAELVPVEVAIVKRGRISDFILLSTNLETEKMADVYSRVQGLVQEMYVEEGDFVKKGQVLISLEADEYVLAEEKAHLNYEKQKSDFSRLQAMFEQNLLSNEEFEQARFSLKSLEVDWSQAKLNLSYTRITGPISGVVGDRMRKLGDRIQPSDKLFTLINTDEMIAVVYAPEKELGNVRKNQAAFLTSDNLRNENFDGWIKRVSPVVDPKSGTFKITIGVKNRNNSLRAGMFVNTHIITAVHENAVLIPKTAVVYENEQINVFVVKDSVATKQLLKVGFQDHEKVESLEGIEEGDHIIIVGQAGLKDKTRVNIVNIKDEHLVAADGKTE